MGNVTVRNIGAGGLVADNRGSIINSYAMGNVTVGNIGAGGLVASNRGSIINSYATGAVSGNSEIGGLVGFLHQDGSIINSYATGAVTGNSDTGGLIGASGRGIVTASYWDAKTSKQLTSAGGDGVTSATTIQLKSPIAPGTTTTEVYYGWSRTHWDFGDTTTYPALRYAKGDDLNACMTEIRPSSTALPCGILLPDQSGRDRGLAGVFFFADGKVAATQLTPPFSQLSYSYALTITSDRDMQLRPYAINDNATITITDHKNQNYFAGNKPNGALSDAIKWQGNATTLTVVVTDTIDGTMTDTTYIYAVTRISPLIITEIAVNPSGVINEGSNAAITFAVRGGVDDRAYAYTLDGQLLSSPSPSPFTFTIPSNLVDSDRSTSTVELKIIVSDEIQVVENSVEITVRKINNDDNFNLSSEVSGSRLSAIFAGTDADGEGVVSYQWQQLELGGGWRDIAAATTPTYHLPADTDGEYPLSRQCTTYRRSRLCDPLSTRPV